VGTNAVLQVYYRIGMQCNLSLISFVVPEKNTVAALLHS
jgi:hypothetical protein